MAPINENLRALGEWMFGEGAWMFGELEFVRREAQIDAQLAYDAWRELPGRDGYAVYRAAQDRADAAQDQLAGWVRGAQQICVD